MPLLLGIEDPIPLELATANAANEGGHYLSISLSQKSVTYKHGIIRMAVVGHYALKPSNRSKVELIAIFE